MNVCQNTYSEVYSYLETLGYDYVNRIPEEEYSKIIKYRNKDFYPKYSISDFTNKLSKEAQCLIIAFHLKYWCNTKEEKNRIIKILNDNEEKIIKKYEVFKNKDIKNKKAIQKNNNTSLIQIEKNGIFYKIKKILKTIINKLK